MNILPVPTGSPRNLTVMVLSPRSIEITWIPPDEQERHGIIVKYTVNVTSLPSGEVITLMDTPETSLTISNLKPYSKYLVGVKAATTVGEGPYGDFIQASTPEDGI